MFRGQRRANATNSDWQAHTEDAEEESEGDRPAKRMVVTP